MRVLHFADLHLDAPFAWTGATGEVARRRRERLRQALKVVAALAVEEHVHALFCGGDLYEHDRVTPDTAAFLRSTFAELAPIRVFLAPGNHDWLGPQSVYSTVDWTPNVHVFNTSQLAPVTLDDGLTLWGAAHLVPANTDGFFDRGFRVDRGGVHLALFHGAERSWITNQESGKQPHAPFDAAQLEAAGIQHAFLGHYHRPSHGPHHTYPGNPAPLAFGEDGERGAVLAEIAQNGHVTASVRRVAEADAHDLALDVTGCDSRDEVRRRALGVAGERRGVARVTLVGELHQDVDLHERDLRDWLSVFEAITVRAGDLRPGYDIDLIRAERTVRGQFVNDVLAAGLEADEQRRILVTGLRALDGRGDLEVA